jgi:hypothetical protein
MQYVACINSFAACSALMADEPEIDPLAPAKFAEKAESDAWVRSQKHPGFYTTLPVLSIRDTAHSGVGYPRHLVQTPELASLGSDLGTPEEIECIDAKLTCSASFFLADGEYELVTSNIGRLQLESDGSSLERIDRWFSSLYDAIYKLFPTVTVEMILAVAGCYQLHMTVERDVKTSSALSWLPRQHNPSMRRREQIVRVIQQSLQDQIERLSLVLPGESFLLPHIRSHHPVAGDRAKAIPFVGVEFDNAGADMPQGSAYCLSCEVASVDEDKAVCAVEHVVRSEPDAMLGRKRDFSVEELEIMVKLSDDGLSWREIAGRIFPGPRVSQKQIDKVRLACRYFRKSRPTGPQHDGTDRSVSDGSSDTSPQTS